MPDLALALNFGNGGLVSVFLGKPDGTFPNAPPHQVENAYTVGNGPYSLTAGDFNGDGKLDIAVANSTDNTISILLGNGDGTFQPQVTYATGPAPFSIASGDFNRDGRLDLAVTSRDSNTVGILLGNGDGTFQAHVDYPTASSPVFVTTGDFNGDGKLDLAVGAFDTVSILLGNGDGTFRTHNDFSFSGGVDSIAVADFNLDGKQDLAALGVNGAGIQIFLGNGDGTFTVGANYAIGPLLNLSVTAADLNGDGKPDLVATNEGFQTQYGSSVSVLIGNGDGTFQPHVDYRTCNSPDGVTTLDVNRDGHPDIVVACGGGGPTGMILLSNTFSVLLNSGNGTFGVSAQSPIGAVSPVQIVAADLNGDGKLDLAGLVGSGPTSTTGFVLLGKGDGTFQSALTFPEASYAANLLAADFNGDGKMDLAYADAVFPGTGDVVSVLLGNGDGTFQAHLDTSLPSFPGAMISGDFNNDGKLDLAVQANFGTSGIGLLLGNGDGTFQPPVVIGTGLAGSLAAADVNGDGKLDLLIASSSLIVLLGNGNGTFQSPRTFGSNLSGYIAVGDFNGDGKLDVAVGAWTFLGNGDGTFQPPIRSGASLSGADTFGAATVADLNGDGKLDLVAGGSVFLGNGDGTFQIAGNYAPVSIPAASGGSVSAVPADFNGEGTVDLAIAANYSTSVSVLLNIPTVALSAASLSFGSQAVGTTSASQAIMLSNPGSMTLSVAGITATGDFLQTNDCGTTLGVRANCVVNVTFTPKSAGAVAGSLSIADNAPGSPQTVRLNGMGADFALTYTSSGTTITAGQTASYTLKISPTGGFAQAVALSCSGAPSEATCSISPASVTLNGSTGSTATVTVTTTARSKVTPRPQTTLPLGKHPAPAGPLLVVWLVGSLLAAASAVAALSGVRRLTDSPVRDGRYSGAYALAATLLVVLAWAACGGGGGGVTHNAGTPPGSYSLTLTATYTSGSTTLQHTLALPLTVD